MHSHFKNCVSKIYPFSTFIHSNHILYLLILYCIILLYHHDCNVTLQYGLESSNKLNVINIVILINAYQRIIFNFLLHYIFNLYLQNYLIEIQSIINLHIPGLIPFFKTALYLLLPLYTFIHSYTYSLTHIIYVIVLYCILFVFLCYVTL